MTLTRQPLFLRAGLWDEIARLFFSFIRLCPVWVSSQYGICYGHIFSAFLHSLRGYPRRKQHRDACFCI